ncbi:MAG: Crp/Fnr family transcriptional regulator [Cetobacterium sp.]
MEPNFFKLIKSKFMVTEYFKKKYSKGEFIELKKDKFFILSRGNISIEINNTNFDNFKIIELYEGEMIAPLFAFEKIEYLPIYIIANTEVEIFEVDKKVFFSKMINDSSDFSMFFNYISNKSTTLFQKVLFSTMTIEEKFLAYLNLNKDEDNIIFIDKNMTELAKELFVTRTALYKIINNLIEREVVRRVDTKIFKLIK